MARVRIPGRILHEFMMQNEPESRNPLGVSSVEGFEAQGGKAEQYQPERILRTHSRFQEDIQSIEFWHTTG